MINEIFASPIRKYHIDNQQDQIQWAEQEYNNSKFNLPSPFNKVVSQVPEWVSKPYEEIAENYREDNDNYTLESSSSFLSQNLFRGLNFQ